MKKFKAIWVVLMAIFFAVCLTSCIHRASNIKDYDPITGRLVHWEGQGEINFLGILSVKSYKTKGRDLETTIGDLNYDPDEAAIKAVSDGMLAEIFKIWSPI